MKKFLAIVLTIVLSLNFVVTVAFAENLNLQTGDSFQSGAYNAEEYYVCPIQPGTPEWNKLSIQEKYTVSAIDVSAVATMATEAVLLSALNYPFLIDIYAYDDINDGIEIVREYCPALNELLTRPDALAVVVSYLQAYNEQGTERATEYYIATRLCQYLSRTTGVSPRYLIDPTTGHRVAYVYTPNGSQVFVYFSIAWDAQYTYNEAYAVSLDMEEIYGVTMIRQPDRSYNCHSYAWHSTASNNPYWMDEPSAYITDGSYISSTATVGNKITYKMSNGKYFHSGIVSGSGEITSKWGMLGVFKHGLTNNPYYLEAPIINYWELN